MKKIVFLDAGTIGSDIDMHKLNNLGKFISYPHTNNDQIIERIYDADIVIVNKVKITKEVIDACPKLQLICVAATGVNNIDTEYAKEKSIQVKNVAGYSTASVTQVTFSILLELLTKTSLFNKYVQSGQYSQSNSFTYMSQTFSELAGLRFGIIGMGTIGKSVARVAEAFGAEVCYFSTSGNNNSAPQYIRLSKDELLTSCDIICIHAPLNEKTRNLITKIELQKMKRSAILLNMGRGGIVNEADLAGAIDVGIIAGAGIDVFEQEPLPANHPFLHMKHAERFVLTPHIGWASLEARKRLFEKIVENIRTF